MINWPWSGSIKDPKENSETPPSFHVGDTVYCVDPISREAEVVTLKQPTIVLEEKVIPQVRGFLVMAEWVKAPVRYWIVSSLRLLGVTGEILKEVPETSLRKIEEPKEGPVYDNKDCCF